MSEKLLERKTQKFMFDLNNFDDDVVEEVEFVEPPPPTFSEEEMESAKNKSFRDGQQKGRDDALKESSESREQFVAEQLQIIAQSLPQIFEKEQERETRYETESVKLNLQLFEKLFPFLHDIYGEDNLKASISNILEKQSGQKEVVISVHPDAKEGIEQHLQTLSSGGTQMDLVIKADPDIAAGACKISWSDGGAVKNPQALASEIFGFIKDTLAGYETNSHDGTEKVDLPSEIDQTNNELTDNKLISEDQDAYAPPDREIKDSTEPSDNTEELEGPNDILENPDE